MNEEAEIEALNVLEAAETLYMKAVYNNNKANRTPEEAWRAIEGATINVEKALNRFKAVFKKGEA